MHLSNRTMPRVALKIPVNSEPPISIIALAKRLAMSEAAIYRLLRNCSLCGGLASNGHVFTMRDDRAPLALCATCIAMIGETQRPLNEKDR
jgi:hypothetical protein